MRGRDSEPAAAASTGDRAWAPISWGALLLLVLLLAVGVTILSLRSSSEDAQHADDFRVVVLRLQATVIDAETGQRGYLASGDRRFLEPYDAAIEQWRATYDRARLLAAADPEVLRPLESIEPDLLAKFDEMKQTMAARDSGVVGPELAARMLVGKTEMDAIRSGLQEALAAEVRVDGQRRRREAIRTRAAYLALTAAALALVFLTTRARAARRAQVRIEEQRRRSTEEILALNQRLEKRTHDLEEANRELESFSYSVSHDLRAPIRHIAGFTELLRKHAAATFDDKTRHYVSTIEQSANRAGDLVDKLLEFSRMGRSELARTTVDMKSCLDATWRDLASDREGRNVELEVGTLPSVKGDPVLLRLVLQNLLSNALKYTRTRERAVVEVRAREEAGEVVFSVKDNGVGFDMRYVSKLFGVFQRLHGPDEFEGIGIGLANVRRIVQRHGGRVWGEGIEDGGATFYFALPR